MMKEISKEISEKILEEMCDDEFKSNFQSMIRSRYPLFYITHNEEKRFLKFIDNYCRVFGYECYTWDCYNGMVDLTKKEKVAGVSDDMASNPMAPLDYIIGQSHTFETKSEKVGEKKDDGVNGVIYVLLDYFRFIDSSNPIPDLERRLKDIASRNSIISTIMTGPYYTSTDVLSNLLPVIDFPFPNKKEIKQALCQVVEGVSRFLPQIKVKTKEVEEDLVKSVNGLTIHEAQTAFSKSIVKCKGWDIDTILEEKKQIIKKGNLLEYFDSSVSLDDVGGLKNLVNWIKDRKSSFSQEAEDYGLPKPRGMLTLGIPGTGKSLVCKAISSAWGMPLLRLDFGKMFGSLVGDSERNIREAIKMAEAVSPSILWIDEIEKGLSGMSSSGKSDGGTTSRVLSTFLTWMQEKKSSVFVVATANDHESIPPEFLRAGRFDEIFFVDLPNEAEREEIFSVLLKKRNISIKGMNLSLLANNSKNYSGAEIEKAIDNAMLIGFSDKRRKIKDNDIIYALSQFKSLYEMKEGEFEGLQDWASKRCVKANEEYKEKVSHGIDSMPDIDID